MLDSSQEPGQFVKQWVDIRRLDGIPAKWFDRAERVILFHWIGVSFLVSSPGRYLVMGSSRSTSDWSSSRFEKTFETEPIRYNES